MPYRPTLPIRLLLAWLKNGAIGVISNSIAAPLASRLQIYGTERWAASRGPETFVDYRECSLVDLTVFKEGERQHQRFDIIDLSPPTSQTLLTP